jgi:hypothetical protein
MQVAKISLGHQWQLSVVPLVDFINRANGGTELKLAMYLSKFCKLL